jgi:hypothetical protein
MEEKGAQEQESAHKDSKKEKEATTDRKPRMTTAEFGEPATKEEGKPFDATTAPRKEEYRAKDVSQDIQDQATKAPRKQSENDNTSGTA